MHRLALLGAGRIGRVHAANVASAGAVLAMVCDPVREAAESLAAQHGCGWCTDPLEALADCDAALICSATDTHASLIEACAAAGKHVFCEKPIDLSLDRIDRALAAVSRAGVLFQVGFNRRFDPGVREVKRLAASHLGQVEIVRITSRDPVPPPTEYARVCGGIFLDMTIHDFDMARYLAGSEVVEVFAAGAVRVDLEAGELDTAVVTLRFANGALACIDNSRRAVYGYDQRVEVFGSRGMAATRNEPVDTHVHCDAEGSHGPRIRDFFMDRYAASYREELVAFVRCLSSGETPEVTGRDGRAAVALALAAQDSARRGVAVALR